MRSRVTVLGVCVVVVMTALVCGCAHDTKSRLNTALTVPAALANWEFQKAQLADCEKAHADALAQLKAGHETVLKRLETLKPQLYLPDYLAELARENAAYEEKVVKENKAFEKAHAVIAQRVATAEKVYKAAHGE